MTTTIYIPQTGTGPGTGNGGLILPGHPSWPTLPPWAQPVYVPGHQAQPHIWC